LTLVDLPAIFREHLQDEVPGRRLFLDYCHLTIEGVRVAAAAMADAALSHIGRSPGWRTLARTDLRVPAETDACAHLLAAVHNATWNQPNDVIRHHCTTAVGRWPGVEGVMRLFLDFYVRRAPSWACGSFERLVGLQNASLLTHLFNPRSLLVDKPLHADLVTALSSAVATQVVEFPTSIDSLLEAEHGLTCRGIDLLGTSYHLQPLPASPDHGVFAFRRMFERESRFQIVCRDGDGLSLTLVHREPASRSTDVVAVAVNDLPVGVLESSSRWRADTLAVPADVLRRGLNHIVLTWPELPWSDAARREEIARRLEHGELADPRPVYGELYRLRAARAPSAPVTSAAGDGAADGEMESRS
jgi:hypothetical protein